MKLQLTEEKLNTYLYPKIINILNNKKKDKMQSYYTNDGKNINFTEEAISKGFSVVDSLIKNGVNYEDALAFCFIFSPDYNNIKEQNDKGLININRHIENAIERNVWNEGSSLYVLFSLFSRKYLDKLSKDLSDPLIVYTIFDIKKEKIKND